MAGVKVTDTFYFSLSLSRADRDVVLRRPQIIAQSLADSKEETNSIISSIEVNFLTEAFFKNGK